MVAIVTTFVSWVISNKKSQGGLIIYKDRSLVKENFQYTNDLLTHTIYELPSSTAWMSQEVSKWLVSKL